MKKRLLMAAVTMIMTASAFAQFEQGKLYFGASATGLNLSYSGSTELNLGAQVVGGYFFEDDLMVTGIAGYEHQGGDFSYDKLVLGGGGRYYIEQNGIFLGVNAKYVHAKHYDDFMPGVEVGYCYFLGRTATIEPAIYYDQSFKDHSEYSTFGVKVGIGIYLFTDR